MTKQRDWPNAMREIRDQAADVAMDGIRALAPLVDGERVEPDGDDPPGIPGAQGIGADRLAVAEGRRADPA